MYLHYQRHKVVTRSPETRIATGKRQSTLAGFSDTCFILPLALIKVTCWCDHNYQNDQQSIKQAEHQEELAQSRVVDSASQVPDVHPEGRRKAE